MFVCEWTSLLGQHSFCQVLAQSVLLMAELQSLTKWGLQWKSCQLLVCDGMCAVPGHGASQPQLIQGKREEFCVSLFTFFMAGRWIPLCVSFPESAFEQGVSQELHSLFGTEQETHTESAGFQFLWTFCFSVYKCQLLDLQSVLTLF